MAGAIVGSGLTTQLGRVCTGRGAVKAMLIRLLVHIVAFLSLGMVAAQAAGIIVGQFCVEGVARKEAPSAEIDVGNGVWTTLTYSYGVSRGSSSAATLVVFSKAIAPNDAVSPTCSNAKVAAAAQGASVILEGRLRNFSMRLDRLTTRGVNSFVIAPHSFVATIGSVTSGFSKVGGGVLDLSGSRAWINNPGQLNIAGTGLAGTLRLETWGRTLREAVFSTTGGATFTQTLVSNPKGNTIIDLDTATGVASLYEADFAAKNVSVSDLTLNGEFATFANASLKLKRLRLATERGKTNVSMLDATGSAREGTIGASPLTAQVGSMDFTWKVATTNGVVSSETIGLGPLTFADLGVRSDNTSVSLSGAQILQGSAEASFVALGSQNIKGSVKFVSPKLPALEFALPIGSVPMAQLSFDGTPQDLLVNGAVNADQLVLGGLGFRAPVAMSFEKKPGDSQIQIPLNVHVGNTSGSFEAKDDQQSVVLTAALKRLDLVGSLWVNLTDITDSRIEVLPDQLGFDLETAVTVKPFLAGTKPSLAQFGVHGGNSTLLDITKDGAKGAVDIETPTLIVANPILRIGENGTGAAIAVSLTAAGSATIRYELSASNVRLVAGTFGLSDVHVASTDPNFVADLGGTLVGRPDFTLETLSITMKKDETQGHVNGSGFAFSATEITSTPPSGQGLAYRGTLTAPLTIASIEGAVQVDDKHIGLADLALKTVGFSIDNAMFDFGKGMRLNNAFFALSTDEIRSVSGQQPDTEPANGVYFTNLRLNAAGSLQLGGDINLLNQPRISNLNVVLNGRSDLLNGSGSAMFDGFAGTFDTQIGTGFTCDGGDELMVPVRAQLASGPSFLSLRASSGKFTSRGDFVGMAVSLVSTATKSCSSGHKTYKKDAVYGSMTGWCPTWSDPGRTCTWSTIIVPEVSIGYRLKLNILALHASAVMTNPRLLIEDNNTSFCNVGAMTLAAPAIIAAYTPQLDDNGIIAQAINVLVEGVALGVESTIVTGLLNGVALQVNNPLLNAVGSAFCVIKGGYDVD